MYLVVCNAAPEEAKRLAQKLVLEKLAACVNVLPGVMSYYYWGDRYCEDDETTLLIKVKKENYPRFLERLVELHSYKVPEVIAIDPATVHEPYLRWVRGEDAKG